MKFAGITEKRMVPGFMAIFFILAMMLPGTAEAQFKLPKDFCGKRS